MNRLYVLCVVFLGLFASSLPAGAQDKQGAAVCGEGVAITEECQKQFDAWWKQELEWRWQKAVLPNRASYLGSRLSLVDRPAPPWWLKAHCWNMIETGTAGQSAVCGPYNEALNYDWVAHIAPPATVTMTRSVVTQVNESNSVVEFLLRNTHIDGLWTNSSTGQRTIGFVGTHLTLAHQGRIYLWGPPGIMLLRLPNGKVSITWTWGIDIFLGDVPLPMGMEGRLFLSLAKAFGQKVDKASEFNANKGKEMIGLSITIK